MPDAPKLDIRHAHSARVYNYWLGGKDNFAADRDAAEQAIAANPGIVADVRANREFLVRAVRFLASECGVRQFLDIGAGLPTANNTHEVAQAAAPDARIVYVDNDPMVLRHAQALLSSSPEGRTAYVESDLRDTSAIIREASSTLDFGAPIALMLSGPGRADRMGADILTGPGARRRTAPPGGQPSRPASELSSGYSAGRTATASTD